MHVDGVTHIQVSYVTGMPYGMLAVNRLTNLANVIKCLLKQIHANNKGIKINFLRAEIIHYLDANRTKR